MTELSNLMIDTNHQIHEAQNMQSRLNAKHIHIYACAYSNFKKSDAEKIFNETRWGKKNTLPM